MELSPLWRNEMVVAVLLLVVPVFLGCEYASSGRDGTPCKAAGPSRPLSKLPTAVIQVASLKLGTSSMADAIAAFGDTSRLPRRETEPETVCYQRNGLFIYFEAGGLAGGLISLDIRLPTPNAPPLTRAPTRLRTCLGFGLRGCFKPTVIRHT